MCSSYIESYKDLYHGTIESNANSIIDTQTFIPSTQGWCGPGVYFYDNRSKAWWSAKRTCNYAKLNGNPYATPTVVIADIKPLNKENILDLRATGDLNDFADFVNKFLSEFDFSFEQNLSEDEYIKQKRASLLSFYCQENNKQLIIGHFKQKPQEKLDSMTCFANEWQLVIGIETIYCAKNTDIIDNIRRR